MEEWSFFPISKKTKKVWKTAPLCLIWEIWKERNRVVFEDLPFSYSRLKNSFVNTLSSWAGILGLGEDTIVRIFFVPSLSLLWGGKFLLPLYFLFRLGSLQFISCILWGF